MFELTDLGTMLDLLSIVLSISLFVKQRWTIESKKFLQIDLIDEDEWKIGHYLKRREALYTWRAQILFFIGIGKGLRSAFMYIWE